MNKEEVLRKLSEFCHSRLAKDEAAMVYLTEERKLTKQTIRKFQIGVFPQDLRELFPVIDAKILRSYELIWNASSSPFQTRDLIMPVKDVYGNYVAIAGRTRFSEEKRKQKNVSKYYNSRYSKTTHLFGLNFAKRAILKSREVYVVEGHYDVITPHQHEMENIVAICGKSLSTRHIALLSRYANKITLLFDNEDDAQARARKIAEKKQQEGIQLVVRNPFPKDRSIKDIDQFIRERSVEELQSELVAGGEFDDINPPSW